MEESVYKISSQVSTISRNQKYFRTRENRNFDTVRNTEGRIVNFSLIQSGLIVCMGALQVFVVRFFFQVWAYPRTDPLRLRSILIIFQGRAQGIRINSNHGNRFFYALRHTTVALKHIIFVGISWRGSQLVFGAERKVTAMLGRRLTI